MHFILSGTGFQPVVFSHKTGKRSDRHCNHCAPFAKKGSVTDKVCHQSDKKRHIGQITALNKPVCSKKLAKDLRIL